MNKKMKYLFAAAVLVLVLAIGYSWSGNTNYGNDEDSIEEVINSLDAYKSKPNEILGIYDFYDDRVVAFLSDYNPAIIRFKSDENGNYNLVSSEMQTDVNINNFLLDVGNNDDEYFVITIKNRDSNINEFVFMANQTEYSVIFESDSPFVHLTELKNESDNEFRFEWPDLN